MKRVFHLSSALSHPDEQRPSQLTSIRRACRFVSLVVVCLVLSLATLVPEAAAALDAGAPQQTLHGPMNISRACAGQNAEVEEATASPYIYQAWIGCGGIGYARSTDSGASYSSAVEVPGSGGAWDPSLAVGPTGTVYVAFMLNSGGYYYPVVEASFDHGATFTQSTSLKPGKPGNFGDRDFIAVGASGTVYVTWDYDPDASNIKLICSQSGSCAYSNGELNEVIQKSTDGGKTFGAMIPIGPGYPMMGADMAPLLVDPAGNIDSMYLGHKTDPGTYLLHPGHEYFTRSTDGGITWSSAPQKIHPEVGSVALKSWWIDGSIAIDASGTLYVTWDTQTKSGDIGYISYSTDAGTTWSTAVRVTPDTDNAAHIVQVVGGPAGTAYVAWLTNVPAKGWATYLQTFTTSGGLLGSPVRVSTAYGTSSVWPGDTFGLATLSNKRIAISWGSANNGSSTSEIYATIVNASGSFLTYVPQVQVQEPNSIQ